MPTCSNHNGNGNCNCGLVSVPVPEEDRPEAETEEEAEKVRCECCNEPESDCSCYTCDGCEERVESVCDRCDRCSDCCSSNGECFYCDCCQRTRDSSYRCSNCENCDRCCECFGCDRCGNQVYGKEWCSDCDRCTDCCRCEDSTSHCEHIEGRNVFHAASRKEHRRNPSKRFLSAEMEIAALESPSKSDSIVETCRQWGAGIVHDGSLPDTGFEICTAPASGDRFISQVTEIGAALKRAGAKVTAACGLHVHIDARDYSYYELRRLIRLYAVIEEALFSVVPESRRSNTYCARCADDYLTAIESGSYKKVKEAVAVAVYKDTDLKDKRLNKYESARYRALNLHSWFYRGTVECRLAAGTADPEKVVNWAVLWCGIIDWVYTHNDKDVEALKGKGGWEVRLSLAPVPVVAEWLRMRRSKFGE